MPNLIESTITARSQTTLPASVRRVLGLKPGQKVAYVIEGDQVRLVNPAVDDADDPVIDGLLALIAADVSRRGRVREVPPELLARARALTRGVTLDHDAPIEGDVGL